MKLQPMKQYHLEALLNAFGSKRVAHFIERGDIFKVSLGTYEVLY